MTVLLETKRFILKLPVQTDFNDLLALRTDPAVMQHIGTGEIQTRDQEEEHIANAAAYFEKYGLGFFCVFEKDSGNFVGQAGLFHLRFDETQSDIELTYRLHKKFWGKGYGTELSKSLINWGFTVKKFPKIIALVHSENEASRRVMEKAGMFYRGMIDHRGNQTPCYEILNSPVNYADIQFIPASLNEYPTIQNMGRFYVYDMSEYLGREAGWELPTDGLYECIDFKKYWQTDDSFPFLIKYQNELAGFVIIDKKGSDKNIEFNMAQFFILRKFKHKKIGKHVAYQCFNKFRGTWEVMVIPGNEGAYRFWRRIIKEYTNNHYSEYTREIAHFNNSVKNIFRFDSRLPQ